jgi:hypothetical protein
MHVFFNRDKCLQVAHVIRSIGPEFAAYSEEIERQQIDGGMLTSLSFDVVMRASGGGLCDHRV